MLAIREIAKLSFADAIRNKVAYGVFTFLFLLLATASALASVTMGRTELMILDLGLGGISILGNLMAMIITIQSLQQERESRTLYVLMTRLQGRWKYLVGKFLGLAAVLSIQIIIMCAVLAACIAFFGQIFWLSFVQASLMTLFEVYIIIAVSLLFAQSSSLFLAILLTLAVDISGRFTFVIQQLGEQSENLIVQGFTQSMYYVLPNLEAINLRNQAGYMAHIPWHELGSMMLYAGSELAFIVLIASLIFERKNLS
ncbi:MAG: ABC transporter permease subunit [Mariprofundaceae bacterium]|nr:ABC transporter permease subunit [Mariprofundaceae bacterium]